jgi:hypothetical protein
MSPRSGLPLGSENKHSIGTMTERTTQSCIELPWVSHASLPLGEQLIAIYSVLHPRHKLVYFQRAGWTAEWIAAAKKIVRDEFDRSYRFRDEVTLATGPEDTNDDPKAKNLFDNLPAFRTISFGEQDELMHYLSTVPEDVKNEGVLKWWYEHKHVYPHLYRMALDYHTIPCKWILFLYSI